MAETVAPHDRSRTETPKRGVAVLLTALLLGGALAAGLLAVVPRIRAHTERLGFLSTLPLDDQYFDYVVLETKAAYTEQAPPARIWGVGDSSCLFGFAVPAFRETSGLSALNLGTFGFVSTSGHALLLQRMLQRYPAPAAVVVWLHPWTLAASDEANEEKGYREWLAYRLSHGEPPHGSFSFRLNDGFGGYVRSIWLDQAKWRLPQMGQLVTPVSAQRLLVDNDGWFATPARPAITPLPAQHIHPDARRGLEQLGSLCAKARLPLFVAVMPYVRGGECDDAYQRSIRAQIATALGEATIVDAMPLSVDAGVMQSASHFGSDEAVRVTRLVAGFIAERVAGSEFLRGSAAP